MLVIVGLIVLVILAWAFYPSWNRRQVCIRKLCAREDINLSAETAQVAQAKGVPADDVERLWNALATFHCVPSAKLRRKDRIAKELSGLFGHPDYDILMSPLFLSDKELSQRTLQNVVALEDLIAAIYQLEQAQGMLATRPVDDAQGSRHEWIE